MRGRVEFKAGFRPAWIFGPRSYRGFTNVYALGQSAQDGGNVEAKADRSSNNRAVHSCLVGRWPRGT